MVKFEKITKYASLITFLLLALSVFLNLLFQGAIYNYYVDMANSCDVENDFWNIAKNYKQVGVLFSDISNVLFWLFIILLGIYLSICLCKIIKKFRNQKHTDD